jgi:excisionase family DNA binding protein
MQNSNDAKVCTTQEAARMLGMSVTTVQQLVERGELTAWKTRGGHRRIPLSAVDAFKAVSSSSVPFRNEDKASVICNLLVVEDDAMHRLIYEKQIGAWDMPICMTFCDNGYQALIELASRKYDVLFADIMMNGVDGYEVLKNVTSNAVISDIHIAVLSAAQIETFELRGGLPPGVVFFPKPVVFDELKGYLRACCAQKARMTGTRSDVV